MQLSELRIGNYVLFNGIITNLSKRDMWALCDDRCFDEQPIPLTEEWLVRLGFEKVDYSTDGISVLPCYEKNIILEKIVDDWSLCDHSFENVQLISYVHQLQNLYFALTGEELTIKETVKS